MARAACERRFTEPVIELVCKPGVRALVAGECHATSGGPVDRVHDAEHNRGPFPRGVIVITLPLPSF